MPMLRNRRPAVVASLAVGVLVAFGCQPRNEFVPPPPPAVEVAMPVERPVADYLEFTGTTEAVATVELRSRVNGYLEQIHFEDGQMVEQGQLLFTIEQDPFRTKLAMAKAEQEKAKAQLQLARSELSRLETLVRRDAGTAQELDVKRAERDGAAATVDAAGAAVDDANLQLGYTEVRAPIAGRIGRHLVDVGNLVQVEQTVMATIESYDPFFVYFTLSDNQLLELRRQGADGASSPLQSGEQPLEMGLEGEDGFPHRGTLDFTESGVDPATGTLQLRGVFPNPDHAVLPGLFARLRTQVGEPRPRLLVPESARGIDQQGVYVLVVKEAVQEDPAGVEQKVHLVERRSVTLGRTVEVEDGPAAERMSVVVDGLDGTEQIVVSGLQRARPGSPVDPQPTGAAAEAAAAEAATAEAAPEPINSPAESESRAESGQQAESHPAPAGATAAAPAETRPR